MNETTQERLDTLTAKLIDLGDRLIDAAEPAGRVAWEVALSAIQLKAVLQLSFGVFSAVVLVGFLLTFVYAFRRASSASKAWDEASYSKGDIPSAREAANREMNIFIPMAVISGVVSITAFIFAAARLLSTNIWIAAVSPEASIALRILGM